MLASVPGVVRMPCEYCKCPVELFRQHQASKFVRECHPPQGQHRLRQPGSPIRPAASWPDGKDNQLLARIPARP